MKGFPAWYPDMNIWALDPPVSWPVNVLHNRKRLDLSDLSFSAPVTDDGLLKGFLEIEIVDVENGKLNLSLSAELFSVLRNYSTWQLRENSEFHAPLVHGRIVRCNS